MFRKVLVLSASAGAGHIRAAQAIEKALVKLNAAEEIQNIDTLQYTNKLFRSLYSKAYIEMVKKAPGVFGWLYDYTDKPWQNERKRLAFTKLNTRRFIKMLTTYQPDIIICTYFLPAEIISWLKAKQRINARQVITVTDFDVHAMWLCHHFEQYFVSLEETREHLKQLGVPEKKLTVSGIPIDPVFAERKDKKEMRQKYGLAPEKLTILVSAGGFGVGPIENMMMVLQKLRTPAQIVAMCGHNEELRKRLNYLSDMKFNGHVKIHPVGFTDQMDEYMSASDILLGKTGGLTTSEALAKGLVFVIVNPIRGQEERNSDHLLEHGVGVRCNNIPVLAYKIDKMLEEPGRFEMMQRRSLAMGRPNAAVDIVQKILEM